VQFHHEHGGEGAFEDFQRRWAANKELSLSYTDNEKDWDTCNKMGSDMIRLYAAVQPSLPIPMGGNSVWQRKYFKEVFPGDENYGGIEDEGKLDIVCYVDPAHPKLPKATEKYGAFRPLIVDIKTSAVDFPDQPGMAAFDAQLRRYSWVSGIRDVALLWFVKKGLGYKKGYSISFIEAVGSFGRGQEGVIARVEEEGDSAWIVYNDFMLGEMDRAQGKKGDKLDQTNAAKERAFNWLEQNAVLAPLSAITKQRIQFNAGYVSKESADDAGRNAGRQIMGIVNAWKNKEWSNTFGIRYPKDDRNDSYFRAFVLQDDGYKQQNFTKSDEQSFDELFQEDD
jgi:hypothetical protein